jgi:hypothetical protein
VTTHTSHITPFHSKHGERQEQLCSEPFGPLSAAQKAAPAIHKFGKGGSRFKEELPENNDLPITAPSVAITLNPPTTSKNGKANSKFKDELLPENADLPATGPSVVVTSAPPQIPKHGKPDSKFIEDFDDSSAYKEGSTPLDPTASPSESAPETQQGLRREQSADDTTLAAMQKP